MAIETLSPNDLVLFDKTYSERLSLRQSLLHQYPDEIVGVTDTSDVRIGLAVRELYSFLFELYLPTRYPTIFGKCHDKETSMIMIKNLVTNKTIKEEASLHRTLATIAENVDEDFFILLPHDQNNPDGGYYRLDAHSACFPSGFIPKDKLGKSLAGIHGPVPRYKEKLQKSMDRFFSRLEPGKFVKRENWTVTVDEGLYSNINKSSPIIQSNPNKVTLKDLDLNKAFLRCERQTLHRLPTSGAIVFAFHTYLYPIQDIKAEGSGEDLALAIDGLERGSVPEIYKYKDGEKWGHAIKDYLRQ
ncbi:hypothetical protein BDV59DRAFT_193880 [Aspergillus ambiguus]|uniref:heme-dependent oxidative N-demethylase family protein n=1 Tax=Aspergillus ambiguus TaxID=176160 RepID=UPI003CCDE563